MGVFDKVEKGLENVVGNVFARAFKGDVQPVEITARLQRELDAETTLLSRDRTLVPNDFSIGLSQHDYDRLTPYGKTLNAEIGGQLMTYASEKGYIFNGPINIDYVLDESLPIGRFTVTSTSVASVDAAAPAQPASRPATLVIEVNGVRHPLTPPGLTIGRGTDADLRINDPGVSRLHAQIKVVQTDTGINVSVEDLGSTNGITVDGVRTRGAVLTQGSRIDIGSTHLTVVSPVSEA